MENYEIILYNINKSKQRIIQSLLKDRIIILFTRILEDLRRYKNPNFYGRLKDTYSVLFPFDEESNTKKIFIKIKSLNLARASGLRLDNDEISYIKFFVDNLDEQCKAKNAEKMRKEIEKIQEKLIIKYFPNSSKILEPFLIGKLISSFGGVEKISKKAAGTIQLIGAERALFRHISKNMPSPKHGIIFYSKKIKESPNRGKTSRVLANKLAIALRMDYYRNFPQPLS